MHDLRFSVRALRRDLRLTTFALLSVALGIGATVTVFSVIDALLLRPLPFREAERLVWIANGDAYDLSARTAQVQYAWALERDSRSLVDVAGYSEFYGVGDHTLTSGAGEPERLTGVEVTRNFFPLLGVSPLVGRHFTAEEAVDDGPRVVLLSHRLWARRFASDPGVVGRAITLDGASATVVGVLPPSFDFGTVFAPGRRVDYYVPFPLTDRKNSQGNTLALVGRMRPGATVAGVQSEVSVIAERARREGEAQRRRTNGFRPLVRELRDHVSGAYRPALLVLAGGVGLVMLMVCANLSNLLLTRATARERELAVRIALGAGRGRLVRQLLTESLVLSGAGAALGLLLAVGGTVALAHASSFRLPLLDQVRVDWTALAFALGAALVTGVVFGLTPALRVSAVRVDESLKDASRGSTGARHEWTRAALVVAELALTCTLLVGAGLLTRSFVRVLDQDLGYRPERAVAVRIDPSRRFASAGERAAYFDEALRRVREAPGVQAAGLTDVLPMGFNRMWSAATARRVPDDQLAFPFVRVVSDGYLRAMGVPLRAGRDFRPTDDSASAPVVVVSAALARKLWPGQDPLGRTIVASDRTSAVVGVVDGLRYQSVEEAAGSDLYFPMRQMPDYSAVYVVARGARPAAELVAAVRAALRPTDPTLALTEVRTLQDIVDQSVSPRRLIVTLLAGFAAFALVLASLGTYAVISYGVAQRRREIGIRMALGATPSRVRSTVLSRTLRLAALGLGVGLLASWALGRVLRGLLFEVGASDPLTFAGTLAVLALVAAAAGYLPARRAARQNPASVLRAE
jgi:putative ABC transport system permease protein